MALHGLKWHFMVFNGRISSSLVVIDPNSFGLVQKNLYVFQSKKKIYDVLISRLFAVLRYQFSVIKVTETQKKAITKDVSQKTAMSVM